MHGLIPRPTPQQLVSTYGGVIHPLLWSEVGLGTRLAYAEVYSLCGGIYLMRRYIAYAEVHILCGGI